MWLSGRVYALNHSNAQQTSVITWNSLNRQFGGTYGSLKEFTSYFRTAYRRSHNHGKEVSTVILRKSVLSVQPKSRMTIN